MRLTIVLLLPFCTVPCFATPPEFAYASGFAADETKVVIRETQATGVSEMTFAQADARENQISPYFSLAKECSWRDVKVSQKRVTTLVCRKKNKSPLSGVTYQIVEEPGPNAACGMPAYTLKCVSGCERASVPKELYAENC